MNLKKKLSIIAIYIIDYNILNKPCSFEDISINIDILFYKMRFTIEYKLSNSLLNHLKSSLEYPLIKSICDKHNIEFNYLLDIIKKKSNAQKIWDNYIKENYEVDNFKLKKK